MQTHTITRSTPRKYKKQVGRGTTRGKTSGRGTKGQKSRSGHRIRPEIRDLIKKYPKLRGHGKNRSRTVNGERERAVVVNVGVISQTVQTGTKITPKSLIALGVIEKRGGVIPMVKILGTGVIDKVIHVFECAVSKQAQEKITAVGGSVHTN